MFPTYYRDVPWHLYRDSQEWTWDIKFSIPTYQRIAVSAMRWHLKIHKYPDLHSHLWREVMKDKYQEELKRQQQEQGKLEAAMNRQEPQAKRDEQLQALDQWLNKQEKQR